MLFNRLLLKPQPSIKYCQLVLGDRSFKRLDMASVGFFFLFLFVTAASAQNNVSSSPQDYSLGSQFPVGDARRCLVQDKNLVRFGVLPGVGWDNLRNLEEGIVVAYNYSRCMTTDDGKFLLPDAVHAIPIKNSELDTSAEIISHWNNFSSTTSRSINAHAGLNVGSFSISGKYSQEYKSVKECQYHEDSSTVRVQARHHMYTVRLQPDNSLSPEFKARLRQIAAHLLLNRNETARFESELLVRDFGTHVLTSIDAGALLYQVDDVSNEYIRKYESNTKTVKASAGASFGNIFGFSTKYTDTVTTTEVDEYTRSVVSSKVKSYGGPVFAPSDFTAKDWTAGIGSDPVALDRSGDPLYFMVTSSNLPDIPVSTQRRLYQSVKAAVELYYRHNTYPGCTNKASPNFSYQANIDDGSCLEPLTNFTFGGVYQTCSQTGSFTDLCSTIREKNPLTGDFSCPSNYQAVLLQDGRQSTSETRRECRRKFGIFKSCRHNTYTVTANYQAYWCASTTSSVPEGSGLMFGGVYMPAVSNPVTRAPRCPEHFYGLHLLRSLTVCVSDDYESGQANAIPFAGFFSCKAGNPLALDEVSGPEANQPNSMEAFFRSEASFPKKCPSGYSRHLAVVDTGCAIHYCVRSGAFSDRTLPTVIRLPCMDPPREGIVYKYSDGLLLAEDGSVWEDESSAEMVRQRYMEDEAVVCSASNDVQNEEGLSAGGVAAISIASTLACSIPLTIVVVVLVRRRKQQPQA